VGPQHAQACPWCTKCNSPPIIGQCTSHRIANGALLCGFDVIVKGLTVGCFDFSQHVYVHCHLERHSGAHIYQILAASA